MKNRALRLAVELCHKSYFEELHPVWAVDVMTVKVGTDDAFFFEGTDRVHLVIRGTQPKFKEWKENFAIKKEYIPGLGNVHSGMYENVEGMWEKLITHPAFGDKKIKITGHSRAAGIAIMLAKKHQMAYNSTPEVITFGGAKFTDKESALFYGLLDITQVSHTLDPVPYLLPFTYKHVGTRMKLWGGGRKHGIDDYFKTVFRID